MSLPNTSIAVSSFGMWVTSMCMKLSTSLLISSPALAACMMPVIFCGTVVRADLRECGEKLAQVAYQGLSRCLLLFPLWAGSICSRRM